MNETFKTAILNPKGKIFGVYFKVAFSHTFCSLLMHRLYDSFYTHFIFIQILAYIFNYWHFLNGWIGRTIAYH